MKWKIWRGLRQLVTADTPWCNHINFLKNIHSTWNLFMVIKSIQNQPRTIYMYENWVRNSILMTRTSQNQQISRNYENHKKAPKVQEMRPRDTLKIKFRSADAANRVNREGPASRTAGAMTRRALSRRVIYLTSGPCPATCEQIYWYIWVRNFDYS